jgi:hypothetical protein
VELSPSAWLRGVTASVLVLAGTALPARSQAAGREWMPTSGPSTAGPVAYDHARERLILVTTDYGGSISTQTWEWDGSTWANHASAVPRRGRPALAYDAARQRLVMFGGWDPSTGSRTAETWEWDGARWELRTPPTSPSPREAHAMVYDAARRRVVMFGGGDPIGDELWEWDGFDWQQRTPTLRPPARWAHALAYDSARQRVVLYGGTTGYMSLSDTWEWDGAAWTQHFPAFDPGARFAHAMTYDVRRQRTVLMGGSASQFTPTEVFEWDGTNWTARPALPEPPTQGAVGHVLAYDETRQRVVLVGGSTRAVADVWEWDGTIWSQRSSGAPSTYASMGRLVEHSRRGRLLLYGGWDGATWEWDGFRWSSLSPNSSPPERIGHALAYDAARDRTVLFGGGWGNPYGWNLLADTWEWDGATWTQRNPSVSPAERADHAMAYDAQRQRVLLFGGYGNGSQLGDTWQWDGSSWTQSTFVLSPSPRSGVAMAYDASRDRVVLFGGWSFADTWEWDGTSWIARTPATIPPARGGHAMTYDARSRRIVMHGGWPDPLGYYPPLSDTWEWDGIDWRPQLTRDAPPAGRALAYHAVTDRVVRLDFGGGTWIYGSIVPANATSFGAGCSRLAAPPTLISGSPRIGDPSFRLELSFADPSTMCVFGLSTSTQSLSLGGGCTLYLLDPIVALPASTNVHGFASVRVAVPMDLSLRGAFVFAQAFVLESAIGIGVSAARRLVIGD